MTVECPGCSTTFPVDPKKVPAGGVHARCSVCGEVFFVDVAAPVHASAPSPAAVLEEETAPAWEEARDEALEVDGGVEGAAPPEEPGDPEVFEEPSLPQETSEEVVAEEPDPGATPEEPFWEEPVGLLAEEEPSWEEPEEVMAEEEVFEASFVPPTDEPLAETVEPVPAELPTPVAEEVPDFDAFGESTEETTEVAGAEAEPVAWGDEDLPEESEGIEGDEVGGPWEVEEEELALEPETPLGESTAPEDVTEAFGQDAFEEEVPVLEAADAEGTFRVDETPAEEELPFVGEVTPEGELAIEAGPEQEEAPAEIPETAFPAEEPTFGEGELIFTMDTPGIAGDEEQAPGFAMGSTSPEGEPQQELPEAEPPVEEPAPPPPPPAPLPTPQFGRRDPKEKAQRLARVLVSDIILYNPDRHQRALEQGRLKEEFEDEIQKSWNEYVEQVGSEIANDTDFFADALNEILAKGRKTF